MENFLSYATPVLKYIAAADYTGIILLVFLIFALFLLVRLSKSESSKFFYDQFFLDDQGKASTSKLAYLSALTVSTWAFIHLTLKGTLTEWYFLTYMTVWVLQRSYSKWIDLQKDFKEKVEKN